MVLNMKAKHLICAMCHEIVQLRSWWGRGTKPLFPSAIFADLLYFDIVELLDIFFLQMSTQYIRGDTWQI